MESETKQDREMYAESVETSQVQSVLDTEGIKSIERSYPISYSVKDFKRFTDRFSKENHIGNTQFASLYRGKIPCGGGFNQTEDKNVTVKLWAKKGQDNCDPEYQKQRLEDEICFLQHNNHPNLVRVIGYLAEGLRYGVIYDLNPVDTLQNLCVKDTFSWMQRIKVAIAIARLLDFLHTCEPLYKVCNLAAAHILIDQDFNPRLVDFGMLSGGILGDRPNLPGRMLFGAYGYVDPEYARSAFDMPGKRDVFAYGVLLLNLIAKRVLTQGKGREPQMDNWSFSEYRRLGVCSLVHESLKSESAYEATVGSAITFLAMRCLDPVPKRRPTMREIVHALRKLPVAGRHSEVIGVKQMPDDALSVKRFPETL